MFRINILAIYNIHKMDMFQNGLENSILESYMGPSGQALTLIDCSSSYYASRCIRSHLCNRYVRLTNVVSLSKSGTNSCERAGALLGKPMDSSASVKEMFDEVES